MDKIPFHGFVHLDKIPFTVCRLVNLSQFGQRGFCQEGILSRHQVNYLKSHICRSLPILYHTVVTHLLASDLTSAAVLIRVIKLSDNKCKSQLYQMSPKTKRKQMLYCAERYCIAEGTFEHFIARIEPYIYFSMLQPTQSASLYSGQTFNNISLSDGYVKIMQW